MVKVTISEKRNPTPQRVSVGENTTLTSWGAIKVNKSDFFPSSFQLKTYDTVIYFDPVKVGKAEPADLILLTHAHPDHFSMEDIKNLLKQETIIVCPKGVAKKLRAVNNKIHIVRPGDQFNHQGILVEATPAYNTRAVFLWFKAHPKAKENVGYVLTLKNGTKLYHAGDTDYISEMKDLNGIDVALIPIGGDNLTMNEEEAARMVNEIKPGIAVPMHYEIKNQTEYQRFLALVNKEIEIVGLE